MSDIQITNGDQSPFDAIRRVTPEGREYWSARELMPLLGYERWERFADAIDRAKIAAHNSGSSVAQNFPASAKVSGTRGPAQADYHLSRYACYLTAMSGDARKAQVAAALTYFAIRTREAEMTTNVRFIVPKTMAAALRMAADEYERAEVAEQQNKMLEARIEKDAPLVAKAEAHSNADNAAVNRQTFAREVQQWGITQGIDVLHEHVYELLRRKGMLVAGERSDRNHATAHATKAGWAWTKKDVKNDHATATTYIRPRGQDLAWKWITDHVSAYGDLKPRSVA